MITKIQYINFIKLIFFIPIGLLSGFIGGYLASFVPRFLIGIPLVFLTFSGVDILDSADKWINIIQWVIANISGYLLAINVSFLIKPLFININKFLLVWGAITGLIVITTTNELTYNDINPLRLWIEIISAISCYVYTYKIFKK